VRCCLRGFIVNVSLKVEFSSMGETKAQKQARNEQEREAATARNDRVQTMQQDLSQETADLFRRFGAFGGMGRR
jgi:hypothetical protein